ncbi:aldolase/citrate lyase family protein [Dickeya sp. CFBP 2040]|uniref:HpcH/HpaI aldolase/citrate lyase family protein n=1 Tax=Dickeya sp. CFBP 2040 TaxID=2718531 RepID=UPI0014456B62
MADFSWLCGPATNEKIFEKGKEFEADFVILDLEDGLALDLKQQGRNRVLAELKNNNPARYAVRINYLADEQGICDLQFFSRNKIAPEYIIIPKFSHLRESEIVKEVLSPFQPKLKIIPVIESIKGLRFLRSATTIPDYITSFHFGAADFSLDMGFNPKKATLTKYKEELSFLCHELNVPIIDSPYFNIDDLSGLQQDCITSKELGYQGKIAIHPQQLASINSVFSLHHDEVNQARNIVERHENETIVKHNGEMTGPPFIKYAQNILHSALTEKGK